MKYVDEFRDGAKAQALARAIAARATRPWSVMEVCGGQTHAIVRFGIDEMLPKGIELLHGPGCPVCVTPAELIDKAIELSLRPGVTLVSYGDMLRVPGSGGSLLDARARGGRVRMVYSPLDAVALAQAAPDEQIVFFAVGFETTAPASALAVRQAEARGLANFSVLVSHVLVPPAMEAILNAPGCRVQGFLAPGHVCVIEGGAAYGRIAAQHRVPVVITGFEPVDLLQGLLQCIEQLESGRAAAENAYARAVRSDGNVGARALVESVFEVSERCWRGVGCIAQSGLRLRESHAAFDAERRFGAVVPGAARDGVCISGLVLQGAKKPFECPAFGSACTPEHPLGATMVSSEGACAAYYRYRRAGLLPE